MPRNGGINNQSNIAGNAGLFPSPRGLIWDETAQTYLYMPMGYGSALAINDANQVVGNSASQAFRWTPNNAANPTAGGTVEMLCDNGAAFCQGSSDLADINQQGDAVGYYAASLNTNGLLWESGQTPINVAPSPYFSNARGINDLDDVVGNVDTNATGTRVAFISDTSSGTRDLYDLNTLLCGGDSYEDWHLAEAWDINNAGQIVGFGDFHGQTHAFLLTPHCVPEPASMALVAAGVCGVLAHTARGRRNARGCVSLDSDATILWLGRSLFFLGQRQSLLGFLCALALVATTLPAKVASAKNYNEAKSNTAQQFTGDQFPGNGYPWYGVGPDEEWSIPGNTVRERSVKITALGGQSPTQLPDGSWHVDSFFDVFFEIDFQVNGGPVMPFQSTGSAHMVGTAPPSAPGDPLRTFDTGAIHIGKSEGPSQKTR
jgi:uncharacterized membrane protein